MSIKAEDLEVVVRAEVDKAIRDMGRFDAAARRSGSEVEKAGGRAERGGKKFNAVGALVKAAAGTMVASMAGKVITAASDLNETLSKTGVVFGPQAEKVTKAADQMAKRFGIVKTEFLDAASGLGLVAKASGESRKEAANLSVRLSKLAADAASFYNVPMADALADFKSGLVGESEPMRKYGVLLSEAAVAQEAVRLGIVKNTKHLTEGQKVQARASLITKGLKDASGDLARTQGSVANRLREVKGRISNYAAEIGTKALPITADFLGWLANKGIPAAQDFGEAFAKDVLPTLKVLADVTGKVAGVLDDLPGPLKSNAAMAGIFALGIWKVNTAVAGSRMSAWVGDLRNAETRMGAVSKASYALGSAVRTLAGGAGLLMLTKSMSEVDDSTRTMEATIGGALTGLAVGGPIGAAIGTIAGFGLSVAKSGRQSSKGFNMAKDAAAAYADTLGVLTGKMTKNTHATVVDNLTKNYKGAVDAANALGISTDLLARDLQGNAAAHAKVNQKIREGILANKMLAVEGGGAIRATDVLTQALGRQGIETANGVKYTKGLRAEMRDARKEAAAQAAQAKVLSGALKGVPTKVVTKLVQDGGKDNLRTIERLVDKYHRTPAQVRTLVKALNIDVTDRQMRTLIDHTKTLGQQHPYVKVDADTRPAWKALNALLNRNWSTVVNVLPFVRAPKRGKADGGTITAASGMTVPGQRAPYGDKVLAYLAPGEEVVSNRHGQADRNRGLLKAINANRMAKGGTAGKVFGVTTGDLLGAFKEGLAPATRLLRGMEKAIRKNASGAREKRALAVLEKFQGRVTANEKRLATVNASLARATANRDALIQAKADFRTQVTQGISSQANVLNSGNNAGSIATSLATQVAKAKEFAANLQKMRTMGYSNAIIQQVASAGIEGGNEVAKALASASAADMASINSSFAQINSIAASTGATLSNQMYDAGIQAANGVIAGLNKQKKQIEATLETIAKGMVKALRKALGIKSPSVVFRRLMNYVGLGAVRGLKDQNKAVALESRKLASAAIHGFGGVSVPGMGYQAAGGPPRGLTPASTGGYAGRAALHVEFKTYNPVAEPQSRTTNKALDRVAALGLV